MKKNLMLSFLLIAGILISLQSCEKELLLSQENGNNKSLMTNAPKMTNSENLFICNGKTISRDDIDFNNKNLTIVHGYGKSKYVFYSHKEMYEWAISQKGLEKFAQSIKDVETARNYAIKTGEIYRDEISKEFEQYMNDNFSTGEKSGGVMYEEPGFEGWSNFMFPVPKARLKRKYDNDLSSFKAFVNSYRLFDRRWWRGYSEAYITIQYIDWSYVSPDIDNKTSSYWAF